MNVLEICRSLPCHRDGGLEWHTLDVIESLEAAGARVTVLTTPSPRTEGEPFAPVRAAGGIHALGDTPGRYTPGFFAKLRGRVRELCEAGCIDMVHAQGFAGVALAGADGVPPVVTTVHGTLFSETPLRAERWDSMGAGERLRSLAKFKHRIAFAPLWKRFLAQAPRVVVDSAFSLRELAREAGHPVAATIVPLGVDLARYAATATRAGDALAFVMAGRHEPLKGHALGIGAVGALGIRTGRRIVLSIAGEGPETPRLREAAALLPPNVECRFEGRVATARLAELLASADAFINPEGAAPAFGLANAEALICGARVLAVDTGATAEVVRGAEDGDLLAEEDAPKPEAWVAALDRLASVLPEPEEIREARRHRARTRFDRAEMARQLLSVFKEARTA